MLTLLPDLNVAPLKYAHVHREHGGPIHSLSFVERALPEGTYFEAFAYLEASCIGETPGPHGTFLAASKPDAVHGAVSDAIAYWAWSFSKREATLRFDLDSSRLGFAAFPGLGVQGAHKRALYSAAERWNLCTWWEGRLAHAELKAPGVNGLQLRSPIVGVATVVIHEPHNDGANFGVGTAATPALAHVAARTALLRNRDRLAGSLATPRQRWFASAPGLKAFEERAKQTNVRVPATVPLLMVDSAVRGPWLPYAHVWRCLFPDTDFREKDRDDYFLF
jgi:hypothetical protein